MTLLAEDPVLWDVVFKMPMERLRFIEARAREAGPAVLDVGCATGMTCHALREAGMAPVGVDINARFIDAARAKDPTGEYHVGDMRTFQLSRAFDLLICLGTTFAYNLTNRQVAQTLRNFHGHLRPGGRLIVDVVNAIAFTGAQPFRRLSRHSFNREGEEAVATIRHGLDLRAQTMTEQVTWRRKDHAVRKDPAESLRLLFPQELAFHLEVAGFIDVELLDGWGGDAQGFGGRRLIALATRPG
ncbi:class I SAM-dependent methyltransferase [Nitrospirillum sp. BR 11828]|uniref:class I SAM-dependent methyltransferase n=1 Tax=Nitrospirillum sp. BR 11828 TaxID=3104325 RepID=UPI002ACA3206|nr:class I SAM-dependent methyltransferase [Nitrospirillum sp. BR 11828]MDZ5648565.1 class I SAM-dependent methyltransferase [Nitrospirillum sp. BR 11828]